MLDSQLHITQRFSLRFIKCFTALFRPKTAFIIFVVCFLSVFLLLPVLFIFSMGLKNGIAPFMHAITEPDAVKAVLLTVQVAILVVPMNLLFGLAAAWAVTKHPFRFKRLLASIIDLPFSVPPVIVGGAFVLIFGRSGWAWPLIEPGLHLSLPWIGSITVRLPQIIFAFPSLVLATVFVTLPLIARELMPLMERQGSKEELVALSLGARGWDIFWKITFPNSRWAILYGSLLCAARAFGEFGAVSVVSGHLRGRTNTLPLHIEVLYNDYALPAAFACASLFALSALLAVFLKSSLQWHYRQDLSASQRSD